MSRDDIVREMMSIMCVKYRVALKVFRLSSKPLDTYEIIGTSDRPMSQQEALRHVEKAKTRIALVDEGP